MWIAVGAGVFVVLMVWILVKAAMFGRRRSAAIKEWAFRNGMQYVEGPVDVDSITKMPQYEMHSVISRKAWNVVSGHRDRFDITVFDLHETTGNRNTRTYTTKTVAVMKLPAPLPPFRLMTLGKLKPGGFAANMLGAIERMAVNMDGGRHGSVIDLPDHPGLLLLSREPDATRALFTSAIIDYFTQHGGYGITAEGTSLMIDRTQTRPAATVEQIERLVNDATAIAQQFHHGF